jgi:hypothetical protein
LAEIGKSREQNADLSALEAQHHMTKITDVNDAGKPIEPWLISYKALAEQRDMLLEALKVQVKNLGDILDNYDAHDSVFEELFKAEALIKAVERE